MIMGIMMRVRARWGLIMRSMISGQGVRDGCIISIPLGGMFGRVVNFRSFFYTSRFFVVGIKPYVSVP